MLLNSQRSHIPAKTASGSFARTNACERSDACKSNRRFPVLCHATGTGGSHILGVRKPGTRRISCSGMREHGTRRLFKWPRNSLPEMGAGSILGMQANAPPFSLCLWRLYSASLSLSLSHYNSHLWKSFWIWFSFFIFFSKCACAEIGFFFFFFSFLQLHVDRQVDRQIRSSFFLSFFLSLLLLLIYFCVCVFVSLWSRRQDSRLLIRTSRLETLDPDFKTQDLITTIRAPFCAALKQHARFQKPSFLMGSVQVSLANPQNGVHVKLGGS